MGGSTTAGACRRQRYSGGTRTRWPDGRHEPAGARTAEAIPRPDQGTAAQAMRGAYRLASNGCRPRLCDDGRRDGRPRRGERGSSNRAQQYTSPRRGAGDAGGVAGTRRALCGPQFPDRAHDQRGVCRAATGYYGRSERWRSPGWKFPNRQDDGTPVRRERVGQGGL
jgi:hypothetical protein